MANQKDSQLTSATPIITDAVRGLDDPAGTPISVTFLLSAIQTLFNASVSTVTGVKTFGSAGAVSKLKVAGTTSGAVTLDTSAVAGTAVITIPAVTDTLVGKATTDALTNKRITRRAVTVTQSATPAINIDITDIAQITALAQAITSLSSGLTGTPVNGDELDVEITDDGTARAITHGASFVGSTLAALPSTTIVNKKLYQKFRWSTALSKWVLLATASDL